jgi:excisionase family DNA binding protein
MGWTANQAAEYLNLRPKTIKAMAARRMVPAMKLGKSWVFDETTLREWLQTRTRENVKPCPSTKSGNPRIGRFASKSLASRLDAALEQANGTPPRSLKNSSAVICGDTSNSENNTGLEQMP